MFRLRSIKISTNPQASCKLNTGHEITNKNIFLLHNLHIKEMSKRFTVKNSNDIGVYVEKQRPRGWYVCTEHSALVLFNAFSKESFRTLEPEVVEAVGDGTQKGPAVGSGDCSERERRGRW